MAVLPLPATAMNSPTADHPHKSPGAGPSHGEAGLRVYLLGALRIERHGMAVKLPPSRKVRALLSYLVMASGGLTRCALCEMLWDAPADPRGELRWCLSKLRGLLSEPAIDRVIARDDTVRLDLRGISDRKSVV